MPSPHDPWVQDEDPPKPSKPMRVKKEEDPEVGDDETFNNGSWELGVEILQKSWVLSQFGVHSGIN